MNSIVESLGELERRIILSVPKKNIEAEVQKRLIKLSKTVKMNGFRVGKVPLSVVSQNYGYSVNVDVIDEQVLEIFNKTLVEKKIKIIVDSSKLTPIHNPAPSKELKFEAKFEVFPEISFTDLSNIEIEKINCEVDEDAFNKALEILKQQKTIFISRNPEEVAQNGDKVTVDFEGKINGEPFKGGKIDNFPFILGENQVLPEFESAVLDLKINESKTFSLTFPNDYHGKDVAGKTADFIVTLKNLEEVKIPEVDEEFIKSVGVADGNFESLKINIKENLTREVKFRLQEKNKSIAFDTLAKNSALTLPKYLVEQELKRLKEVAKNDLKERGFKDFENMPITDETFKDKAEKNVRLGLVLVKFGKDNNIKVTKDEVKDLIKDLSLSYENPKEFEDYYLKNEDDGLLGSFKNQIFENKITEFIFNNAKTTEKKVTFTNFMENKF